MTYLVCPELEVDVKYDYEPEQQETTTDPHIPEEFYVTAVLYKGIDITSELTEEQIEDLKQDIIRKHKPEPEPELEDHDYYERC